jgi:hypothetical protein
MASNSAYSAAAAPFSSRRKRARKAPDFVILDLPFKYPLAATSTELHTQLMALKIDQSPSCALIRTLRIPHRSACRAEEDILPEFFAMPKVIFK